MRPLPVILALLVTVTLSAQKLRFTNAAPESIEAGVPAQVRITIENVSGADLPAAPLHLSVGPGRMQSITPDLGCEVQYTGSQLCTLPALRAGQSLTIEVVVVPLFRYGSLNTGLGVVYGQTDVERFYAQTTYWRDFAVTTTADAGPGSLRQAILDMNATRDCHNRYPDWTWPCRAAFRIQEPLPAEGWYIIRPLTELPALGVWDGAIDGTTQQAPHRPAIALDGSALAAGNGINVRTPAYAQIRGLAIGGFPWDGIHASAMVNLSVRDCYIGIDPTGRRANPNGSRGIVSVIMRATIERNVISGNARSGIWFPPSTIGAGPHIRNNRIGVGAHDDTPMGNGASGIFIGDFPGYYSYPTIEGNVIANNAHFGIALTPNAPMIILGNTIRDNGAGGIDIGLDGPTESRPGTPGVTGGVVPPPVIVSARYADGVTTITGYSNAGTARRQVLLYANSTLEPDGYAEGEQYLGITAPQLRDQTAFTFVYPGDLRGKYINGTSYAMTPWGFDDIAFTSSEFGRAVRVEE